MIKSGKYAVYAGKEYTLNRDMNGNYIIITSDKNYTDNSFEVSRGGGVYKKIVKLSQLDEVYSITVHGIVNGEKVLVLLEKDGNYYVETSDCEIGDKLKLERVDKYGYGGWISSDDIQIVEEKHYIELKKE